MHHESNLKTKKHTTSDWFRVPQFCAHRKHGTEESEVHCLPLSPNPETTIIAHNECFETSRPCSQGQKTVFRAKWTSHSKPRSHTRCEKCVSCTFSSANRFLRPRNVPRTKDIRHRSKKRRCTLLKSTTSDSIVARSCAVKVHIDICAGNFRASGCTQNVRTAGVRELSTNPDLHCIYSKNCRG